MKSRFCALPSMQIKDSLSLTRKSKVTPSSSKSKPTRLPPIVTTSNEDQEQWEIKALPSDWEVKKKPSQPIQRLLEKREREHRETIERMRREMDEVSCTIEDEIRAASNIYKHRLKDGKKETDECLKNIRQILKGPAVLVGAQFLTTVDDIRKTYRLNKNKLWILMQKLRELEHYRSGAFKKILRRAYTKLNDISYKLPFEIQEYFELEIQAINEIILNNIRSSAELKCHLVLQLKNDVRLSLEEVHYIRECWLYYMQLMLFTDLNQNFLYEKECNEEVLNKKATGTADSEKSSVKSYWHDETTIDINKMFNWVYKIERTMTHIDSCAKTLVGSFKEAVIQIARGYYKDMKIAAKKILELGLAEKSEVHILQSEFCGKVVMDVTEKYHQDLSDIQTMWYSIRSAVQTCLEEALVFLNNFAEVWYAHTGRIYKIKNLVLDDVENVMAKHYFLVSAEETKINIKIDTLRQESDEAKLQGLVDEIFKLLDGLKILYNQSYNEECTVLENIVDFYELEGELFQAELKQFLAQFAMYDNTSYGTEQSESNDSTSISSINWLELTGARKLLYTEICMYRKQIRLLYDWKFGLYKIIHKYADNCITENRFTARDWFNSEHYKARLRLKIISDLLHRPRYGRIKPVILELRLAEIEEHDKRFREHEAGLSLEISNTASIYPQHDKQYDEVVEKCKNEVEKIKNRVQNASHGGSVSSTLTFFKNLLTSCTDKVVEINKSYQTNFNAEINRLYLCNLRYVKAIRLFSEGGNFSPDKAKVLCDDLGIMEKIHKKKVASLSEENAKKCAKCLQIFGETKFELTDTLTKYEEELRHYDNYTNTLKDVEVQIKEEVYRLKFKNKHVSSNLKALQDIGEKYIGQPEKVEYFVQETKKFINLMEEYKDMLQRPSTNVKVCGKIAKMGRLSPSLSRSSFENSMGALQSRIRSAMSLADYSAFMFEVCPEKEENFIGKVRHLLYTSFKNLQKDGKEFYEKHMQDELISGDKIHANYQDFISEILPKYVYYYLQCELVWLNMANSYIKKVDEVFLHLKRYRNRSTQKYVDLSHQSLQEAFDNILVKLDNVKSRSNAGFLAIHKKLKPLHGYPGNKAILDALDEEMSEFFQRKLEEISSYSYETYLTDIELNCAMNLFKINDNLEALEKCYEEEELSKGIMDDFIDTLQYLDNFISSPTEFNINDEALTNAFKRLDYYKNAIIIPAEYKLNTSSHTPVYSAGISATSDRVLPNVYVMGWVEDYEKRRDDMIEKVDWVIEENRGVIDEWREMWIKEINNILSLYKVKYDLPKGT